MDDLRPDSRAANALECTGAMGIFFGAVGTAGTFLGLLDIGEWVAPVYWMLAGAVGVLLLSVVLFLIGYRWNRRCYERWRHRGG